MSLVKLTICNHPQRKESAPSQMHHLQSLGTLANRLQRLQRLRRRIGHRNLPCTGMDCLELLGTLLLRRFLGLGLNSCHFLWLVSFANRWRTARTLLQVLYALYSYFSKFLYCDRNFSSCCRLLKYLYLLVALGGNPCSSPMSHTFK